MKDSKTLYLDGHEPLDVRLDGPALVVAGGDRCVGRYPLRRFSRVIVSGHVQWSTTALLSCLEHSIVVTFLDLEGRMRGICLGRGLPTLDRSEVLAEFSGRPDWPEHYLTWRSAMERRFVLRIVKGSALQVEDLRPRHVALASKARLAAQGDDKPVWKVLGFLEGAAATAAAELLLDEGVSPVLLADERCDIHFGRDLGRLLSWDARLQAIRWVEGHNAHDCQGKMALMSAAERLMKRWRRLAGECLDYLERIAMGLKYGRH